MTATVWVGIPVTEIKVGDVVSVRGITNRNSAIVHVGMVDATAERIVVTGWQPWGRGRRFCSRTLHPEARADRLEAPAEQLMRRLKP